MRIVLVIALIFFNLASLFSLSPGDRYSSFEVWKGRDGNGNIVVSGHANTTVTIGAVCPDSVEIRIFKEVTPFSQVLDFEVTAVLINGQYKFSTIDNWKNLAFGYIEDRGDSLEFFVDCSRFSEDGKDLGRLYGDRYEIQRKHY